MYNRPSNWYQMDYSEQREWKKQQQAIEDAEYEASRARQEADDEISRIRQQSQRDAREARNSASEEYNELNEYCEELKGLLRETIDYLPLFDETNLRERIEKELR